MMRYCLLLLTFTFSLGLFAQVPQGINYQAVARDGDGALLINQTVDLEIDFRPVGDGAPFYSESHQVTTNEFGLFTLVLGAGNPTGSTAFDEIDWTVPQELGLIVDGTDLGYTPFQSVPYALGVGPRETIVSVPAAVFTPNNNEAAFRSSLGNGSVEVLSTAGTAFTTVLNAPITLPHGAVVTEMTAYFEDASEAQMRFWLAKELFTPGFNIAVDIDTEGNEAGIRKKTVNANVRINNTDGGYYIRVFCTDWNADGAKRVKGVVLKYTY
jgi:hypothetical protein